jgi:tRNA(fMet)-specific endonuclease VapC
LIVDTDALSAMADGDIELEPVLRIAKAVVLPVIALGEYRYGIRQSRNRIKYERWLDELVLSCRVLDIDEGTTLQYALLREKLKRAGRPIPANDVWIAALAIQHEFPILSRDGHFDSVSQIQRIGW